MSRPRLCRSQAETRRVAAKLGASLATGQTVALTGALGAGKTTFVQGLARGLGVRDLSEVLSPTYTLVNEYPAAHGMLVHVDLYRLDPEPAAARATLRSLGIEEHFGRRDAVVAVEWADRCPELFGPQTVWVRLEAVPGGRRVSVRQTRKPRRTSPP